MKPYDPTLPNTDLPDGAPSREFEPDDETRLETLQRRSDARAEELRQAGPPCLWFPEGKSLVLLHDRDAQAGVQPEKFVMRLGL